MKTYEFRELCICSTISIIIVTICICVTVYGLALLEGWFNVDEKLAAQHNELEKEITKLKEEQNFWIKATRLNSKLTDDLIYRPEWKKQIMPYCFKGQSSGGNRQLKKY